MPNPQSSNRLRVKETRLCQERESLITREFFSSHRDRLVSPSQIGSLAMSR